MIDKQKLETLYRKYNRREFVHPDPLEFLYAYPSLRDREIVAFVAASLAYGRVKQILKSVSQVLSIMGPSPYFYLKDASESKIHRDFNGFVHRFATGKHLSSLLIALQRIIRERGSLYDEFADAFEPEAETVLPALGRFCDRVYEVAVSNPGHLLPLPRRGSACKRLNLFLRWMVRKDAVDPGGWNDISAAKLIVPLDTHMHRMGRRLGFTSRNQANMRTALEITSGFRKITPNDPVRYDFALTRLGIRDDISEKNIGVFF